MGMVCFGTWPMFQAAAIARAQGKWVFAIGNTNSTPASAPSNSVLLGRSVFFHSANSASNSSVDEKVRPWLMMKPIIFCTDFR